MGFLPYDPVVARDRFNGDLVVYIYYQKLLRYDAILPKDGEFFTVSTNKIEQATCIKRRQQERAREWLEANGFIELKLKVHKQAPQLHYKIIDGKSV